MLVDEVHAGRSYQSHFGTRLHFGLGRRDRVKLLEVRWPGGGVEELRDIGADQCLWIREGEGVRPGRIASRPRLPASKFPHFERK